MDFAEIALFLMKFLCQIEKKVVGLAQKFRVGRGAPNTAISFQALVVVVIGSSMSMKVLMWMQNQKLLDINISINCLLIKANTSDLLFISRRLFRVSVIQIYLKQAIYRVTFIPRAQEEAALHRTLNLRKINSPCPQFHL